MTDHKPSINVDKVQLLCLGMRSKGIKAALITQTHNYSWLTDGGRSWVGLATENATAVQLLIVDSEPTKVIALTNSIEAERVKAEEGACVEGGLQFEVVEIPWHDPAAGSKRQEAIDAHTGGAKVESDAPNSALSQLLDASLTPTLSDDEIARYRALGRDCGRVIEHVARTFPKGATEAEIAGMLASGLVSLGIDTTVLLVAADTRLENPRFRHPLPTTGSRAERKCMLVIGGRRHGLICSCTRVVAFADATPDPARLRLASAHMAACTAEVAALQTVGGSGGEEAREAGAVFAAMAAAYAKGGFEGEWKLHHQGGLTGFKARYWRAMPGAKELVQGRQAVAFNPSCQGSKSEDTFLILPSQSGPGLIAECLTVSPSWPTLEVTWEGLTLPRYDILYR
mmetsp:Transcript_1221/g.2737  ORF Transcript_1221/g.2737 Transcript_1221/m.2737 type:complete len:398 (+) Transcript_1221:173-1366(+)